MKINEYHKKRNEEIIRKAKEQPNKTLSIEEVTEQFKRIKQARINKDNPQ
jgi:hypothetical protein